MVRQAGPAFGLPFSPGEGAGARLGLGLPADAENFYGGPPTGGAGVISPCLVYFFYFTLLFSFDWQTGEWHG